MWGELWNRANVLKSKKKTTKTIHCNINDMQFYIIFQIELLKRENLIALLKTFALSCW